MCNLLKSDESAFEELENENNVLLHLRQIKEVADFVPRVHCFTNIWLAQLLVCDFIDGKVYKNYNEMGKEIKMACHQRVKQLHASNILHGDLRAPNFIVQDDGNVFVIDFGRSEILNK